MKTAILASVVASAAAFAPASQTKTSTALNVDLTKEIGAQAPLGVFDPLGVFPDKTNADDAQFERLRWVELKHGRIAMVRFQFETSDRIGSDRNTVEEKFVVSCGRPDDGGRPSVCPLPAVFV